MRIVSSRIEPIGRPAAGPRVPASASVVLFLEDESGRVGMGEAAAIAPGDSASVAALALDGVHRELAGVHLDRPAQAAVARALSPASNLARSRSAQVAVETALLDLIGQALGVPVHRLLGGAPGECRRSGLLSAPLDASHSLAEARALLARGIDTIKAKVGLDLDAELASLRAIRSLGSFRLRLDANRAWSHAEAIEAMARLAPLGVEYLEEPLSGGAMETLPPTLPLAADESLSDDSRLSSLLASPSVAAFVIKPAMAGGLFRAREIAMSAIARGRLAVVTHAFDGPIGVSAACELALSIPGVSACGLDPWPSLEPVPPQLLGGADIRPVARAGLGWSAGDRDRFASEFRDGGEARR